MERLLKLRLAAYLWLVSCLLVPGVTPASTPTSQTIARPTSVEDGAGWSAYLRTMVQQNSEGLAQSRSYLFFVPAGTDMATVLGRQRLAQELKDIAARRVLPGNLVAFGGPDTTATADTVVDALLTADPDWAKGAILLFVGLPADKARVFDALRTSGATLRFADMSGSQPEAVVVTSAPLPNLIPPPPPPPPPPAPRH